MHRWRRGQVPTRVWDGVDVVYPSERATGTTTAAVIRPGRVIRQRGRSSGSVALPVNLQARGWTYQDDYDPVDAAYGSPLDGHWDFPENG